MKLINDIALNKILNDLDYTGPRYDANIQTFRNVLNKCMADKNKVFDVYYSAVILNVDRVAVASEHDIAVRTVQDYILRARKYLHELMLDMDVEGIYTHKEEQPKTFWLSGLLHNNTLRFMKEKGMLDEQVLKNYILSTGPSWYLDIPYLHHVQAKIILEKLGITIPAVTITDDIAKIALEDIGYTREIGYPQITAMRLILQVKATVHPVKTDCYIRNLLGGIDYSILGKMSKDDKDKIDICLGTTRAYLGKDVVVNAIITGIDTVTPCEDEFLIKVAKACKYPVVCA